MTDVAGLKAVAWRGAAVRGGAIALLLGAAACQQGAPQTNAPAAVAAPATPGVGNAVAGLLAPAPAAPAAPGAQPGKPAPGVAPAPPTMQAPAASAAAGSAAADRRVRITNNSGQTITLIKGSAASDSNWGNDRIPAGVLRASDSVVVDFNDNNGECVYDLQATLADGTERVRRTVNVCQITDWTITPGGEQVR